MSKTSVNKTAFVAVFVVIVCLLGVTGCKQADKNECDYDDFYSVSILTSCPNATTSAMEEDIIKPLEQSVKDIYGIRSLTSQSKPGKSQIIIQFERFVDIEQAINSVKDRVSTTAIVLNSDCVHYVFNIIYGIWHYDPVK